MAKPLHEHFFGGAHTEIKLGILESYLKAYMTSLRPHFSDLWYIDAFAGTGSRSIELDDTQARLFPEPATDGIEERRGSARIALDIKPAFDRLIFIDQKPRHCEALEALKPHYPGRQIQVLKGNANTILQDSLSRVKWQNRRGVLFLDPYGMEVEWSTLKSVAATKAIDVWYLFPLSGLFRQAARKAHRIDTDKHAAITRMLGTTEWERDLYAPAPPTLDLFAGLESSEARQRHANVAALEMYVRSRFQTLFPTVLAPFPLPPVKKPQFFSLFFMSANPDPKASALAQKLGRAILKSGHSSHTRP